MWYMRRKYIVLPEMWQETKFGGLACVNFAKMENQLEQFK